MDYSKIDKELAKYLKTYKRKQLDLKDNLQVVFDMIKVEDINNILSKADLKRFKRYLDNNEELVKDNGYCAYMVKKYRNKTRIRYKEMLEVMILICYVKFEKDLNKDQLETITNVAEEQSKIIESKCKELGFKKTKKKNIIDLVFAYLATIGATGLTYKEQNDSYASYNASQMYKQAMVDVSQNKQPKIDNYKELLLQQQRREINKKKDSNQEDKYSGAIDIELTYILNQMALETYKDYGVEEVIFKGINDNRQTQMCESLDGQIFKINKMNTYSRYSKDDDRNVIYHTKGLVIGENLPPINNSFHYCRSWIEPYRR